MKGVNKDPAAMSTHINGDQLDHAVIHDGPVLRLDRLHFQATKVDVEKLLTDRGFHNRNFYWRPHATTNETKLLGWCFVQFEDMDEADTAAQALQGALLKGIPIMVGSIQSVQTIQRVTGMRPRPEPPSESDGALSPQDDKPTFFHNPTAAAAAKKSLKLIGLRDYPFDWTYDRHAPKRFRESLMKRMKVLEEEYEKAGIISRPMVLNIGAGQDVLRSQQFPSLNGKFPSHMISTYIYATRGRGKDIRFKRVNLKHLDTFKSEGWTEWYHPGKPISLNTEKDLRKIPRTEDVWNIDQPHRDTQQIFPTAIALFGQSSSEGKQAANLFSNDAKIQSSISYSSFIVPAESGKNLASATSRGHILKFPRPSRTGAGWGDYDLFREWQLHGRQVKGAMVKEKKWQSSTVSTLEFVPASDAAPETKGISVECRHDYSEKPIRNDGPKSLYSRFHRLSTDEDADWEV